MILFLGGTTNNSMWRADLIPLLVYENLAYFNPVVDDWNDGAFEREMAIKGQPDTVELYTITKEMKGVYSIAEAVDASNKKPDKTIFLVISEGFDNSQIKSLEATQKTIENNGAYIANSLYEAALIFKGICIGENSEDLKNRMASRRSDYLEDIFSPSPPRYGNLSYERVFEKLGVTDLLEKMYIKIQDLSKDYRDAIFIGIKNFLKNPLFKDISLDDEKDLKFLRATEDFEDFLDNIFETIQNKLSSKHSKILEYLENKKDNKDINLEKMLKDLKIDRVTLLFILDDFKENKNIYDFNGREITLN